jgi:acetylcholinesterase
LSIPPHQILQSGTAAGAIEQRGPVFENDFANFVREIPACSALAGNTAALDCIRTANISVDTFVLATLTALIKRNAGATFAPNFDPEAGARAVYPFPPSIALKKGMYAKIPFIAGTDLDEGENPFPPIVPSSFLEEDIRLTTKNSFRDQ